MSDLKPGGFRITDKAMELWKLPKGAKVLDIGCGSGEAVEYLEREYGYDCQGIDLSMARVKEGKARNPELRLEYGDGEFLDGFTSYSLDGVMMECTLSLINLPDEALHEAYCVLKKGGRLFLSDLYVKDPDPAFAKALAIEAERQKKKPHAEGECDTDCAEDHKKRVNTFRASGRFLIEPLLEVLCEIGYVNFTWLDYSQELNNFVAETMMREGGLEGCICDEALHPKDKFKTGYFLLTAEKPL